MTFKIHEPLNMKKAIKFTRSLPQDVALGLRKGMNQSGKLLTNYTREQMTSSPKSGRRYLIYTGRGGRRLASPRPHTASAANEYPAVITGKLRKSIGYNVYGSSRLEFGARAKYAKYLELGTRKIKPRKYLKQTVKRFDKQVEIILTRRINNAMRKRGVRVR
jgi:HK97 gp10 family phage protein